MISVEQSIFEFAKQNPQKIALKSGKTAVSYGELVSRSFAAKNYFEGMPNYRKGSCVILAAGKQVEFAYAYFGAHLAVSATQLWGCLHRDASYVVTDSFHGTVFSIIFGKEFECLYNKSRGSARFESLPKLYESGKLDEMRIFSMNWLKKALEN